MAQVQIRDHVLWIKHIQGDAELSAFLSAMPPGAIVDLLVDGNRGVWRKMDAGKDGLMTPGLKPIEGARSHWHGLQARRGALVSVDLAQEF